MASMVKDKIECCLVAKVQMVSGRMHRLSGDRRLFPPSLLRISTRWAPSPHKINNPDFFRYRSRLSLACCMLHVNPASDSCNRQTYRRVRSRIYCHDFYYASTPKSHTDRWIVAVIGERMPQTTTSDRRSFARFNQTTFTSSRSRQPS